jgi:hypothetical protein
VPDYKSLITDRIYSLSRQYEETTGKRAFLCRIPPRKIAERGVYIFADGTVLVSAEGAISHMELLMNLANVRVNEP